MTSDGIWLSVFHLERLYKWTSFACQHPGNEMECVCQIIISLSNTTELNFFNLMNSGLVSHFGVMLQFGLCKEVIYISRVLLFAPVGEDNRHNEVSSALLFFLKAWLSSGICRRAGQGRYAAWCYSNRSMMKSSAPFGRYEENGWNEKLIIGLENHCPVWLPGNSFIFTAIYSNLGWLRGPALGLKTTCEYTEVQKNTSRTTLIITLNHVLYI